MTKCSEKKIEKCCNKHHINTQVVQHSFANISGSLTTQDISDKSLFYVNYLINKITPKCVLCQTNTNKLFPKRARLRDLTIHIQISIFPQLSKIFRSLASEYFNSKFIKNDINQSLKLLYSYSDSLITLLLITCSVQKDWGVSHHRILLAGDVELNPGPEQAINNDHAVSVKIITFNARGLKDKSKLKRILNKCYNILKTNPDSFILFQETHLDETECKVLELLWRENFSVSPGIGRQAGVVTLFSSTWAKTGEFKDFNGRFCSTVVTKYGQQLCINNIYAPNDHDINFFTDLYNKIFEIKDQAPGIKVVIAGDFNLVLGQGDSVNRGSNNSERRSRKFILEQNSLLGLKDSYRVGCPKGGFTWSRGNCMSRLDMVLLSHSMIELGVGAKLDWGFDVSDHALLEINISIKCTQLKGKGLYRVSTRILENEYSVEEVRNELKFQFSLIPEQWDPHRKLDFVKMTIRSVMSLVAGKQSRREESDQEALANQLNLLRQTKERLITDNREQETISNIDREISLMEIDLEKYLNEKSKYLISRSGAKWYEEGEKSNAYFLNILKKRQEQTLITKLKKGSDLITGQEQITNHIVEFYSNLYSLKETEETFDDLFSEMELPQLNDDDRRVLDAPVSLDELERTLKGCEESAPGPDGISYMIYKRFWPEVGKFLLDSWNKSVSEGVLPEDQRISCITLLPKENKDLDKIENWRPITLTNCDLKIFTKLLANRVAGILDRVIAPSQTAYVPGRVVHDNLRMFNFYKNYCKEHNINALLVSLDAKKAFDSVSHKYLHEVLKRYGFSDSFIELIKLLYNDLKANVMVNGFKSVLIRIERSVKQGDALSCALFILCIDPLIRKLESNKKIKCVPVPRAIYSNIKIEGKVGGFADDIGLAVNNDIDTINEIFKDYAIFSKLSGIELNVDKTEILVLSQDSEVNPFIPTNFSIGNNIVKSSESVKVCGIVFSNNSRVEYQHNVLDKISKLEKQLVRWLPRHLSMEGKLTIVKTFGLSQLIYSLQMCDIKQAEIKHTENLIFRFLWNKKWTGNTAPDRIKRSVLKLPYESGGLRAPDIDVLNKALKTKQFLRAMSTKHIISDIQKFILEKEGYFEYFKTEYAKTCKLDPVIEGYQVTTNYLTDQMRSGKALEDVNNDEVAQHRVNVIASTDIIEYFRRKKIPLVIYRFRRLANVGIETVHQLINESIFPRDDDLQICAQEVLSFLPAGWVNLVMDASEVNSEITYNGSYFANKWQLFNTAAITVKSLRTVLLHKPENMVFPFQIHEKFELLNVDREDNNPFLLVRRALHAPRDKSYKYRILQGDIFCNKRMHKFKMVDSPNCGECPDQIESIKHVLWECPRAVRAWSYLNSITRNWLSREYVNYETIILGNKDPNMAMETIITWILKLLLAKNRDHISQSQIDAKLKSLFFNEKSAFRLKTNKLRARWGPLLGMFSGNTGPNT